MKDFCINDYFKYKGTRIEFSNLFKNKFNLNCSDGAVINFIKRLNLNKERILKGFYITCIQCKKSFYLSDSAKKYRKNIRFCSKSCYGHFVKGIYPKNIPKESWKRQ